jgi:hypothetical protein
LVEVEIGTYTSPDFDRKEVPLWMFLQYLQLASEAGNDESESLPRMYLAQNILLPELEALIRTPAICDNFGFGDLYNVNMWIGPGKVVNRN